MQDENWKMFANFRYKIHFSNILDGKIFQFPQAALKIVDARVTLVSSQQMQFRHDAFSSSSC